MRAVRSAIEQPASPNARMATRLLLLCHTVAYTCKRNAELKLDNDTVAVLFKSLMDDLPESMPLLIHAKHYSDKSMIRTFLPMFLRHMLTDPTVTRDTLGSLILFAARLRHSVFLDDDSTFTMLKHLSTQYVGSLCLPLSSAERCVLEQCLVFLGPKVPASNAQVDDMVSLLSSPLKIPAHSFENIEYTYSLFLQFSRLYNACKESSTPSVAAELEIFFDNLTFDALKSCILCLELCYTISELSTVFTQITKCLRLNGGSLNVCYKIISCLIFSLSDHASVFINDSFVVAIPDSEELVAPLDGLQNRELSLVGLLQYDFSPVALALIGAPSTTCSNQGISLLPNLWSLVPRSRATTIAADALFSFFTGMLFRGQNEDQTVPSTCGPVLSTDPASDSIVLCCDPMVFCRSDSIRLGFLPLVFMYTTKPFVCRLLMKVVAPAISGVLPQYPILLNLFGLLSGSDAIRTYAAENLLGQEYIQRLFGPYNGIPVSITLTDIDNALLQSRDFAVYMPSLSRTLSSGSNIWDIFTAASEAMRNIQAMVVCNSDDEFGRTDCFRSLLLLLFYLEDNEYNTDAKQAGETLKYCLEILHLRECIATVLRRTSVISGLSVAFIDAAPALSVHMLLALWYTTSLIITNGCFAPLFDELAINSTAYPYTSLSSYFAASSLLHDISSTGFFVRYALAFDAGIRGTTWRILIHEITYLSGISDRLTEAKRSSSMFNPIYRSVLSTSVRAIQDTSETDSARQKLQTFNLRGLTALANTILAYNKPEIVLDLILQDADALNVLKDTVNTQINTGSPTFVDALELFDALLMAFDALKAEAESQLQGLKLENRTLVGLQDLTQHFQCSFTVTNLNAVVVRIMMFYTSALAILPSNAEAFMSCYRRLKTGVLSVMAFLLPALASSAKNPLSLPLSFVVFLNFTTILQRLAENVTTLPSRQTQLAFSALVCHYVDVALTSLVSCRSNNQLTIARCATLGKQLIAIVTCLQTRISCSDKDQSLTTEASDMWESLPPSSIIAWANASYEYLSTLDINRLSSYFAIAMQTVFSSTPIVSHVSRSLSESILESGSFNIFKCLSDISTWLISLQSHMWPRCSTFASLSLLLHRFSSAIADMDLSLPEMNRALLAIISRDSLALLRTSISRLQKSQDNHESIYIAVYLSLLKRGEQEYLLGSTFTTDFAKYLASIAQHSLSHNNSEASNSQSISVLESTYGFFRLTGCGAAFLTRFFSRTTADVFLESYGYTVVFGLLANSFSLSNSPQALVQLLEILNSMVNGFLIHTTGEFRSTVAHHLLDSLFTCCSFVFDTSIGHNNDTTVQVFSLLVDVLNGLCSVLYDSDSYPANIPESVFNNYSVMILKATSLATGYYTSPVPMFEGITVRFLSLVTVLCCPALITDEVLRSVIVLASTIKALLEKEKAPLGTSFFGARRMDISCLCLLSSIRNCISNTDMRKADVLPSILLKHLRYIFKS